MCTAEDHPQWQEEMKQEMKQEMEQEMEQETPDSWGELLL